MVVSKQICIFVVEIFPRDCNIAVEMNSKILLITTKSDLEKLVAEIVRQLPAHTLNRKWLTLRETAALLGISTSKVNLMRYNRQITFTQTSERTFLYAIDSINQILEQNRCNSLNP